LAGKGLEGLVTPDDGFIYNCCQWEQLCAARGEGEGPGMVHKWRGMPG